MRLAARSAFFVMAIASFGMVACGGGGGDDGPIVIEGEHHLYVADFVGLPDSEENSEAYGVDLDGDRGGDCEDVSDATYDNQLGVILTALATQAGDDIDLQMSVTERVDDGTILLLADVQATALDSAANAGFSIFLGANPSTAPCTDPENPTTCRQHFNGTTEFEIAPGSPTDLSIGGNISGGTFSGSNGELAIQIAFGDTTINLDLIMAHAELHDVSADGIGQSVIAGAVPNTTVQSEVIPAVHVAITAILLEACGPVADRDPEADCSCTDSTSQFLMNTFDDDDDCDVGLEELRMDSLIMTLLRPDIDTDCDGTDDALSVGVGATAVPAVYEVP
jgi:hypothetical protein